MKQMKKILAMAMALVMVFALATTAFAADIIVDDGDVKDAKYSAYKLLNLTSSLKTNAHPEGCNGENHIDGCYNYAYTVNAKYRTALQKVIDNDLTDTVVPTDDAIIAAISEMDADEIRDFADAIFAEIKNVGADYETTTNKFEGAAQGYYLIVETETGSVEDFDEDTYSLVMLDTAGQEEVTIKTKEELPESEKKLQDINDSTGVQDKDENRTEGPEWIDGADHDIGDKVPFQITFTLPADFAEYETYYVGIHDIQSAGLTYNEDLVVTVNGDTNKTFANGFTYSKVATDACDEGCTFHIVCNDIIAAATANGFTLKAGDKIVFNYTSTLNEDAEFGATGNPNDMTIEFSNNPYGDGTSKTPWDRVIVFTYKVDVDKYTTIDGNEVGLKGAGFTLYKEVANAETAGAKKGAAIKQELAALNPAIKAGILDDETYYVIAAEVKTDADGDTFSFEGVDDGNYVLVETTIPAGYNAWDAEAFTITAEHDIVDADPKLIDLEGGDLLKGDVETGILKGKVENNSGFELPSTGGIGTTIFYVIGGLLAVAAIVLLIAKKRMASAE